MGHQRPDIAVVAALWRGQYRPVMFAKRQQRFFIAQAFEQRQAQGFESAFVLSGGFVDVTVLESLRLVVVATGNQRQGGGKNQFAALYACAQGGGDRVV